MLKLFVFIDFLYCLFLISFLFNFASFIPARGERSDLPQENNIEKSNDFNQKDDETKLTKMLSMDMNEMLKRMDILFEKIDVDRSNTLSLDEVNTWVNIVKAKANERDALLELKSIDEDKDGKISFDEMKKIHFESEDDNKRDLEDLKNRFGAVDKDSDGYLNVKEIAIWLNPYNDSELINIEINYILEMQDKNKDGFISLDEFLYSEQNKEDLSETDKEQMSAEFNLYDLNGDALISKEEIRKVIITPTGNDVKESIDKVMNNSVEISKAEWKKNINKYIISVITDNGELLRFPEDYNLGLNYKNVIKKTSDEDVENDVKHNNNEVYDEEDEEDEDDIPNLKENNDEL